jgi:hypothetical protein
MIKRLCAEVAGSVCRRCQDFSGLFTAKPGILVSVPAIRQTGSRGAQQARKNSSGQGMEQKTAFAQIVLHGDAKRNRDENPVRSAGSVVREASGFPFER